MKFVRFVSLEWDCRAGGHLGAFCAAQRLEDGDALDDPERGRLGAALDWFDDHLPVPGYFDRADAAPDAVCWFFGEASEPVRRTWDLVTLLQDHGVFVRLMKATNPGRVVYTDRWQAVVRPWGHLRQRRR